MQMGQFIDHDITHTPNHAEDCCNKDGTFPDSFSTDKCYPIRIDESDPFWGSKGKTCMNLARSLKAPDLNCSLQFRQQVRHLSLIAKNAQHASGQNGYEIPGYVIMVLKLIGLAAWKAMYSIIFRFFR